jgi:hypothetical protein
MTDTLDATDALDAAAGLIRRAVLDAPLTQGERSYLGAVATRLASMTERIRADAEPEAAEPTPLRRPGKFYSRTEAAALVGCDPNTLLNWEARGLLTVRRDARGWRTYGREELARAYALAARVPLDELPAADTHR